MSEPLQLRQQLMKQLSRAPTTGLDTALQAFSERPISPKETAARHAIVVLGVPVNADGSLSAGLQLRVERAARVARLHPAAPVLVTGGAVANGYRESRAMAEALTRLGIDARRIYQEPYARTTLDNAAFTLSLLKHIWPASPGRPLHLTLVSEPYHAIRALRLFAAAKVTFNIEATLHIATSNQGPVPARMAHDTPIRLGGMPIRSEAQALLSRCIEEKRRISCGW